MKINLIDDIHAMTQISNKILNKIVYISNLVICDALNELDIQGESTLDINIGLGTISLYKKDNSIWYNFKPSNSLETAIITTEVEKSSPLTHKIKLNLENKITSTYKELI